MRRFSAPRDRPPWLLGMRANERAVLEAWNNSGRLRDKFIAEFIRDALFLDLSGIVSGVQTVGGGGDQFKQIEKVILHFDQTPGCVYSLESNLPAAT